MKFENNNTVDTIELPASTFHDLCNFTMTIWVNISRLVSYGCFITVGHAGNTNEFHFCHNIAAIKGALM